MWLKPKGVPLSEGYPFFWLHNIYGLGNAVVKAKLCDYNVSILSGAENPLQCILERRIRYSVSQRVHLENKEQPLISTMCGEQGD